MFEIGDKVVYGTTGVCRIADITPPPVRGMEKDELYYLLKPLYQEGTIYTPVHHCRVKMRPLISSQEAERLIELIPTLKTEAYQAESTALLVEHYQQIFTSSNCADLLELVLSLYAKKQFMTEQRRKLGQVDERFMKRAQELLHGELAAALGLSLLEIPGYIAGRVDGQPRLKNPPDMAANA